MSKSIFFPTEIMNHILSFRPTHPVANLIKNPDCRACLEMCDYWSTTSMLCTETLDLILGNQYTIVEPDNVETMIRDNIVELESLIAKLHPDDEFQMPEIDTDDYTEMYWTRIYHYRDYVDEMYETWNRRYNAFGYDDRSKVWGKLGNVHRTVVHRIHTGDVQSQYRTITAF